MVDFTLTLTADERQYLLELLEASLKNMRVEEHRTRASSFREFVIKQENAVESVLNKLRQTPK